MIRIRPGSARGQFDHGWLRTAHSFAFADYHDPEHTGFRALRVINEDHVAAGTGFDTHPHRDMEIMTWVLAGALEHKDSMGNGAVIRPGEVQIMSAGTGVLHSERNPSATEPVHLLQIWVFPDRRGLPPRYEQRAAPRPSPARPLTLLAAPPGKGGVVAIHQDARILAVDLPARAETSHPLAPGRGAWLQVVRGDLAVNGTALAAGDGAAATDEAALSLSSRGGAHALLFDLA
jgi:redox-sensitive bicupin YhaK (pirin superfamily)